jgi:endonuclease G
MKNSLNEFRKVVADSRDTRARVRSLVAANFRAQAEPDSDRFRRYTERMAAAKTPGGAEALQGATMDLQAVAFLTLGALVRRAIAYVEVNSGNHSDAGTGFLVSPDLFLTNQHVIPDEAAARGAQVIFDREMDEFGRPRPTTTFLLDPDKFALFSSEDNLDYALIAIGARNVGDGAISDYRFCSLSDRPDKHVIGMNVNIVQHPGAWPKMVAIRNNLLSFRTDRTLLYETDTDHGSSGSPVFNDAWELVALHHFGEPFLEHKDEQGRDIPVTVNEGIRISTIYRDLTARLDTLTQEKKALLQQALAYDKIAPSSAAPRALSPPHPANSAHERANKTLAPASIQALTVETPAPPPASEPALRDAIMTDGTSGDGIKVVIPLEISIRLAPGAAATPIATVGAAPTLMPPVPAKTLTRAAEKLTVDADYDSRSGYDPGFIDGFTIPLPAIGAGLAQQIAPLRAGEVNADQGVLAYEHFSLVMNKTKRVAFFTATNIDGTSYLNIDRSTGLVAANAAEGETWFKDPRVSASFFLDQTFYSSWSTYFDRGHLTRRSDPTWGDPATAQRANADTFHFTNCSPQHFRFNQSATFWQGAERYVLEQGALTPGRPARLCVLQGPIYSDAIDRWADDVQIPSSFFKIVVWHGQAGLRAVGIVVDQLQLLDDARTAVRPAGQAPVKVNHWRVAIPTIEGRTGLDFGDVVRGADTIRLRGQPAVGEAQILIRSLDDLLA